MSERSTRLSRNVYALTVVSFFTDVSSEMIYPLLPAFLTVVLGASASFIGAIEGAAESTAALLKLASGWWSDRVQRRKPLVVAGYTIASIMRPLVALARSPSQVLVIRLSDRVGKGIRNSPRDALIADSVDPGNRGRAFGFNRTGDNAGGVVGPLVAVALVEWTHLARRSVFWWAALPAAIAVAAVIFGVREVPRSSTDRQSRPAAPDLSQPLNGRFWAVLGVILLFTLGNSIDAFLLLRARQLGVPVALAPILWALLNIVKATSNIPGGVLSDRLGRKPLLVAGWLLSAAPFFPLGGGPPPPAPPAPPGHYGILFSPTHAPKGALVAHLVPPAR